MNQAKKNSKSVLFFTSSLAVQALIRVPGIRPNTTSTVEQVEVGARHEILVPKPRYGSIYTPLFGTNMKHAVIAYYIYFNHQ